jgi:predicted ATP-grasp superfamily ATP-dependent carboligase
LSEPLHLIIAGVSARAAAESAVRAGFGVTAIDAFGDLDQHPSVRSVRLGERFGPYEAAAAAAGIACDAVIYLSNFENHPKAVAALAAGRTLWGNQPDVLRRVRDPMNVAESLRRRGLPTPEVRLTREQLTAADAEKNWLVKPRASGGGRRIRPWRPGEAFPRNCYMQERIDGVSGSVVFVAAADEVVPLAISRQLIGEQAFGAEGFQYCGNILWRPASGPDAKQETALADAAAVLARAVAAEFRLLGLNGVDFVARDDVPYVVEVNPRWCASMELLELARGISVFDAHAAACMGRPLPAFDLARTPPERGAFGKAVVYARSDATVGDTRTWLNEPEGVRDVPRPGERIIAGHPVCTVFARERDAASCRRALIERAERVYDQLAAWALRGR